MCVRKREKWRKKKSEKREKRREKKRDIKREIEILSDIRGNKNETWLQKKNLPLAGTTRFYQCKHPKSAFLAQ